MEYKSTKRVLIVASENGALRGGKAGGVGDVIAHLPGALANEGMKVTTVIPSYGFLHKKNKVCSQQIVKFPFCGRREEAAIYKVRATKPEKNVSHFVVENMWIRGDPIYSHDLGHRPFATDASKFAMFCSAVGCLIADGVGAFKNIDIIHCHDWHAATLLLLRDIHPNFASLQKIKTVFTIHNLALQGTRPMQGDESSLLAWFPEFDDSQDDLRSRVFSRYVDRRYDMPCYTPMAAGIALADVVNTVSPSYALEILTPSDHVHGYSGGEGLESILQSVEDKGRLFGILNGIDYSNGGALPRWPFSKLRAHIEKNLARLAEVNWTDGVFASRQQSLERIQKWKSRRVKFIATCIGRIVDQKLRLFLGEGSDGKTGLESTLELLAERGGVLIVQGIGVRELEEKLDEAMKRHENFLFIRDYSEAVARRLYTSGDLFLMPSLYEPCGISQLYSMRAGQPALVHHIGGLKDTVRHGIDGFAFDGSSIVEKVDGMTETFKTAMGLFFHDKKAWRRIGLEASQVRFLWSNTAQKYIRDIYLDR